MPRFISAFSLVKISLVNVSEEMIRWMYGLIVVLPGQLFWMVRQVFETIY